MSIDGNLRVIFRRNLCHFFWTTIESYTEPGIPDSYFCFGGVCGWIEFKACDGKKIKSLTPVQVSWHRAHARKGGRSFIFVRRREELFAYSGEEVTNLLEKGLDEAWELKKWRRPWNWAEIEAVLKK